MIYSFNPDDSDHCETPLEAYEDIANYLEQLAIEMLKSKTELRIYDPYFCEGGVKTNLEKLGFTNVYNKNEDFYHMISNNLCPEFDVIITNPPYSNDHMERLLMFCIQSVKPFFLLLPNFVYTKDYYTKNILGRGKFLQAMLFYIVPKRRYKYSTPKGRRQVN